jgi:citrate lyase subunit beta/citryl-CoA lyase
MARSRRSCLSVPGSSERMLVKARDLPADELVLDLEDAVVADRKDAARAAVTAAIRDGAWGGRSLAVRVNGAGTAWHAADVEEVVAGAGDALASLVVPKVEDPAQLREIDARLHATEARTGRAPVGLQALIETAAGLVRAAEIARASPRLEALVIGFADLAASLGRPRAADYPGDRWHHVRETVLVAARSAGLQAIDGPHLDVGDLDGLAVEAGRARALGLDGKWALHPGQIEPINGAFTPAQAEVDRAGAILDALAAAEGRGAVALDGEMIDEASAKLAALLLARGRSAGLMPGGAYSPT